MKKTNRGFSVFDEFYDSYGCKVRVQKSSSAEVEACWIFTEKDGQQAVEHLGLLQSYSPHLSVFQARRLIRALQAFIRESGEKP